MQCMKCGRDLENEQVFCDACLEVMKRYPIKPGTVVQLPYRPQQPVQKKPQRRKAMPTPEEQVLLLRRLSRILAAAVVLLLAVAVGLGWLSVNLYLDGAKKVLPGQNYFAAMSTTAPTTPTTEVTEPPATTLPEYGVAG